MSRIAGLIRFAGSILKDRAHICAFFNSPNEARRVLLPFVKGGLELSQSVLHTNRGRLLWGPHWRQNDCSL